jgi:hypothetical protein
MRQPIRFLLAGHRAELGVGSRGGELGRAAQAEALLVPMFLPTRPLIAGSAAGLRRTEARYLPPTEARTLTLRTSDGGSQLDLDVDKLVEDVPAVGAPERCERITAVFFTVVLFPDVAGDRTADG